jgi:DNA polymerase
MPTFHPAYLLRSPGEKRSAWLDLQKVMKVFGRQAKGGPE